MVTRETAPCLPSSSGISSAGARPPGIPAPPFAASGEGAAFFAGGSANGSKNFPPPEGLVPEAGGTLFAGEMPADGCEGAPPPPGAYPVPEGAAETEGARPPGAPAPDDVTPKSCRTRGEIPSSRMSFATESIFLARFSYISLTCKFRSASHRYLSDSRPSNRHARAPSLSPRAAASPALRTMESQCSNNGFFFMSPSPY